ncbi:MAG: hypothetical protein ACI9GM_000446 [Salibacteraceae bacterium]|jgi:hypothetical protein
MTKREEIFSAFKIKSGVKQDVHAKTLDAFGLVKTVLQGVASDYQSYLKGLDNGVVITYKDRGMYGASLSFGGDILVFQMHSNVFSFEDSHPLHKNSYVNEKETRVFCGIIHVYNFLADSFKYNRQNDLGFLVSRIFVNQENHLFVEGKGDLSYRYADFATQTVTADILTQIIESSIQYALDFDLYTPEFHKSQLVSVGQMLQLSKDQKTVTAKRLGFRMADDSEDVYKKKKKRSTFS